MWLDYHKIRIETFFGHTKRNSLSVRIGVSSGIESEHTLTWLFEHHTLLALYDSVYGAVARAHESEISMQARDAIALALYVSAHR